MRSTRAIGSSTGSRLELNERWRTGTNSRAPAVSAMAVCEVIPPSTERVDRSRKMPIYAREGVAATQLRHQPSGTHSNYKRGARVTRAP